MLYDAVVLGAGPAGATASLALAPFRRVLVIEREPRPLWRIGESVPGAARRLLTDLGLWDGFAADGHMPRHALTSAWGAPDPVIRDALADPDGPGWQIDRVRFEGRLRDEAARRGAVFLCPARATHVARAADGWHVGVEGNGRSGTVSCRLLIDASGRGAPRLAAHGARRRVEDRLVCAWLHLRAAPFPAGLVQIEAEPEGWWYAAALPGGDGVLAFYTDADLPAAREVRHAATLLARACRLPMLGAWAVQASADSATHGICAAHGAWLEPAAGDGWLATGDAALAVDPIAAQGLFDALYLGLAAAEAADRHLAGDGAALPGYAAEVAAIRDTYVARRTAWYRLETRWADRPFWAARNASADPRPRQAFTTVAGSRTRG